MEGAKGEGALLDEEEKTFFGAEGGTDLPPSLLLSLRFVMSGNQGKRSSPSSFSFLA